MAPSRAAETSNKPTSPVVKTPPRGVIKKRISTRQKQALIDNLQLEVTERARKLRAQYALQAHTLRSRIELRVNRIPMSLRRAKVGDLLLKHLHANSQDSKSTSRNPKPAAKSKTIEKEKAKTKVAMSPVINRGAKRTSDVMTGDDKENTPDLGQGIPNPKKRSKPENIRKATDTSTVLSPKSLNSRAQLQSPVRPQLLTQNSGNASRPTSPLKPLSPIKAATATATSMLASMVNEKTQTIKANTAAARKAVKSVAQTKGATTRAKRAAGNRVASGASTTSGSSALSTGTTIVKRVGKALNVSNTTKKKTAATATKKTAPTKPKAEPSAGTVKRVLRKRA